MAQRPRTRSLTQRLANRPLITVQNVRKRARSHISSFFFAKHSRRTAPKIQSVSVRLSKRTVYTFVCGCACFVSITVIELDTLRVNRIYFISPIRNGNFVRVDQRSAASVPVYFRINEQCWCECMQNLHDNETERLVRELLLSRTCRRPRRVC